MLLLVEIIVFKLMKVLLQSVSAICIVYDSFKKLSDYIETLVIYYFQFIQRNLLNNYKLIKCITSESE